MNVKHTSKTLLRKTSIVFLFSGLTLASGLSWAMPTEGKQLGLFIDKMVKKHGFNEADLKNIFSQVEIKPSILAAIKRPAESKPWYEYRNIFLKERRIKGGVKFWNEHAATLQKAEERYGVPAEIIVAIIGVETRYGKHTGSYRIIDALSTLGFEYPRRSKFFLSELENFLIISREERISPLKLKGSYAGAMGQPQFMPSSFRQYAVDFDGDGHRDLWENTADAIGSVANYFRRHHWQTGEPVVTRATVSKKDYSKILDKGLKPHTTLAKLQKAGVTTDASWPGEAKSALFKLDKSETEQQYWVGLQNFYVISRYNRSALYSLAVHQLSQEIMKRRNSEMAANK